MVQVTDALAEPVTVATKVCWAPGPTAALGGATVTSTPCGSPPELEGSAP